MKISKQEWLDSIDCIERDRLLLSKAYDVLCENTYDDPSLPWGNYRVIAPWKRDLAGIWNWDSAFHAIGACRFDTELAKGCIDGFMQFQLPNGMLPDNVTIKAGKPNYRFTKPPVLPWACVFVYKKDGDLEFLKRNYERSVKYESFWRNERFYNGMFFYSAQYDIELRDYVGPRYESGWDNSPRWDTLITDLWPIDLNCYMVMLYRALAEMAEILHKDSQEVEKWHNEALRLSEFVEERLFDNENQCYVDVNRFNGTYSSVLSPASFMPLYIGIASKEHADAMHKLAADKDKFYPGMPTVTYDSECYSNEYWRGTTWLNVAYFAAKGLKDYGYTDTVNGISEFILNMVYKNIDDGIFENYDSVNQKGLFWHCFSWSAVYVMEFILNL